MFSNYVLILVLVLILSVAQGFRLRNLNNFGRSKVLNVNLNDIENVDKRVIIEVVVRRPAFRSETAKEGKITAAYDTVYKEHKDERAVRVLDSPVVKVLEVFCNPTTLVLGVYLSSIGWSKVMWVQKILKIFGRGTLVKKPDGKPTAEELPFQTFECEVCGMEMRPARGRAQAIFGKERFRCSRCGSKSDAYFDIDDMNDPRAVARKERIEKEKEEQENADYGDEDE